MVVNNNNNCTNKTLAIILGSVIGGVILIVGLILLGLAVNKVVENNQYGVVYYSSTTMEFGEIYEQGIYAITPGAKMLIFERTLQDVDLEPIKCFTSDKIIVELTVSVQYQLIRENLIDIILKKYGGNDNYKSILKYVVQNVITDRCGQYSAEDYYVKRGSIDLDMYHSLLSDVNNNTIGATIQFFQLINIQFPSDFSSVINRKQEVIQNAVTIQNQRASLLTAAETELLQAGQYANITISQAKNVADINLRQAQTTSEIIQNQWQKRGLAYKSVKDTLGLSETEFIEYLRSEILRTNDGVKIRI